ncbi:DUF2703 domain-containing protein [Caloramator sp. CAR-1]|uniref:DUF2703 domain-containing protein n=1 Tax=Caloramator sp. CAR-1 TaxID=3062777 RepID=UPI0026E11B58|nr:DUF2703 domain-containing protein [Caloramator sp. CAR-1]MDO6354834.1 DUF2703 domain-containing protein [Caloramator sp. CAR-1]
MENKNKSCCSCGSACCGEVNTKVNKRKLVIDFLYLDLTSCDRCMKTDDTLDEALNEVKRVLEATGIEVVVNKINITNEDLAKKYKFVSSPTIRINGRDIQMDIKESPCKACGDLCGDDVDCRVWVYQGKEYDFPPKEMIIESILKAVYGGSETVKEEEYVMPENLKRFFDGMKKR